MFWFFDEKTAFCLLHVTLGYTHVEWRVQGVVQTLGRVVTVAETSSGDIKLSGFMALS